MPDNTTLSAGTADGAVIAADDIGGVLYPRVKVTFGADGASTDVASGAPLPIIAASNSGVDIGDVTVNNGNGASAVPIQDGGNSITVDNGGTFAVQADTELTTADLDTGGGTDTRAVVGLVGSASGGGQLIPGSGTDGLLVNLGANNDVTVSGVSTAANQSTIIGHVDGIETLLGTIDADTSALAGAVSGTEMQVDVVTSALPTGAATAAKQPALGTAGTASADVITVQGIASMTPLLVNGSGVTQPVSNAGLTALDGAISGTEVQVDVVTMPSVAVTNAGTFAVQAGAAAEDAALSGNPVRTGARASTAIPTAMSADDDVVTLWADRNGSAVVKPRPTATATLANVSGATSSTTLLASNTGRLGAIIVNDSSATCYLKYGSTASATSFTYLLQPGATWEMPGHTLYTGIITGIWTSATGSARTTELS